MSPRLRRASLLPALTLAACAAGPGACAAGDAPPPPAPALETCAEPRPEMCTREYRPACGHRCAAPPCPATERRSYGNACTACADPAVRATAPGACEGGGGEPPPLLR